MAVVLLDPRFPGMIPVDAVDLLRNDVSYTEEVPIRVRWVIADLGGHTVDESDVLVTTDPENELVLFRLEQGEEMITAPSLAVHLEPSKELEAGSAGASEPSSLDAATSATTAGELGGGQGVSGAAGSGGAKHAKSDVDTEVNSEDVQYSGGGVVDGEIVGTDEHTVAVAGLRRTARTEVPASVMDEIEDAVALMARSLRQGEWERSMTHQSLMAYLREETDELDRTIELAQAYGEGEAPEWLEQDLCSELSDILLQVLFHAEIANRRGAFDIGHVAGAFVAKLRSRAPYLFEEIERDVPRTEQDRLWDEGKKRERSARVEKYGEEYAEYLERKDAAADKATDEATDKNADKNADKAADNAANQTAATTKAADEAAEQSGEKSGEGVQEQPRTEPHAKTFPAVNSTQLPQHKAAFTGRASGDQPVQAQPSQEPSQQVTQHSGPQSGSALAAAEQVIREARQMGLRDADIPTDIRFPMVGLELDEPGESDRRLMDAVSAFRAQLQQLESGAGAGIASSSARQK